MTDSSNSGYDEIHLLLSTPGSTVAEGIALYNMIRALPLRVVTYNFGSVNSIGNVVYQASAKRIAATDSSFMFHGVSIDFDNTRMDLKHLQERAEGLKIDQSMICDIMVRHTNLNGANTHRLFLEMAYLNVHEALLSGIIDEVKDIHFPPGLPIRHILL